MASALVNLPSELLEEIASRLPSDDLFALRLTCFTIARKIEHYFTRTYYRHAGFLLNSFSSIKLAIDFVRHPTVGPALREISFFINEASDPNITAEPFDIESNDRLMLMRWLRNRFWEDRFRDMDVWRQSLETLFLELKLQGKLRCINFQQVGVTTQVPVFDKGEAGPAIANISDVLQDVFWEPLAANLPIQLVLEAIVKIGLPIATVRMDTRAPISLQDVSPLQLQLHGRAFAHVRLLKLYICDMDVARIGLESFAKMIAASPTLEKLALLLEVEQKRIISNRIEDSPLFVVLMEQTLPSLKEMMLAGVKMRLGTLVSFVHRHKHLQVLWLWTIYINSLSFATVAHYKERLDEALVRTTHLSQVHTDDTAEHNIRLGQGW